MFPAYPFKKTAGCAAAVLLAAAAPFRAAAGDLSLAEAVERTLGDEPGVEIQQQAVRSTEGLWQSASGAFDWNVLGSLSDAHSRQAVPPFAGPFAVETSESGAASLGVAREFRSGIEVEPLFSVDDLENNTTARSRAAYSNMSVLLTVPLLRGLGAESADAVESAARLGLDAQRASARFAIESQVYGTLVAYWGAQAARQSLQAVQEAAGRGREIAAVVDSFTRSGIMDDGLRSRAQAVVADYDRQAADSELAYFQARQALAVAIGLPAEELIRAPAPAGDLPPPPAAVPDAALAGRFVDESLRHRGDYGALLKAAAEARVLERKAELDLRPELDLSAQVGYAGGAASASSRAGGALSSFSQNVNGPAGQVGLSLAWPVENNVARGNLATQRAQARIAALNATQSGQAIVSNVLVCFASFQVAMRDYDLARLAVAKYRVAADSENAKVRRGDSSLNDLIVVEQSYVAARLAAVTAQYDCALSVARLRLASGLLSVESAGKLSFDLGQLGALPTFSTP
jgi:outer membrane protein TolC